MRDLCTYGFAMRGIPHSHPHRGNEEKPYTHKSPLITISTKVTFYRPVGPSPKRESAALFAVRRRNPHTRPIQAKHGIAALVSTPATKDTQKHGIAACKRLSAKASSAARLITESEDTFCVDRKAFDRVLTT
jgi:hypothetical protein